MTQGQKTDNAQMKNSWIKQLRGPPGKDEGEVERIVPVAGEVGQDDGEKAQVKLYDVSKKLCCVLKSYAVSQKLCRLYKVKELCCVLKAMLCLKSEGAMMCLKRP